MNGYQGEQVLENLIFTPYAQYGPVEWALEFIERYGQTDSAHHKAWVIDQVARILLGTAVEVRKATWLNDGKETVELRINTVEASPAYLEWVKKCLGEVDAETGEAEYGYDEGVAP